jgi:galactose oxidase
MGVLLQGFFKLPPNQAVPSPADGNAATPWWWDHLAAQANALRQAGFTAVWLPPTLKSSAGASKGADGYGPFDDYDIGSKTQMGSVPTRFGSREQLQRCVATFRANGIDVYLDMVEHHRDGDPGNFVFRYKGADDANGIGRFPKNPLNFVPNVPRDPNLGGPPRDDFPFGRELAPIDAKPRNYVFDGLINAADWLTRALDVQGYRLDDVKGLSTDFLFPFLNSKSMQGKFAFGEYFDGNTTLVNGWVFNPHGMRGRASAFDFPLRFILQAMCNNAGRFNMADLDHAGLAGIAPLNSVTFIENHDTDLHSPVVLNKLLGYAYILTSEGYPCVYYRDYSADQNCFGLKPSIDNLIWIHEKLANGSTQQRWKDFGLFAYERLGQPGLLVALNNDPNNTRTITVATSFGANVVLHDYTGHSDDTTTNSQGNVTISVPRNADGHGYVCYSRTGIGGGFIVDTRATTQDFEGAADLDLPPAQSGKVVQVGRIWCDQATGISAFLIVPGLSGAAEIQLDIVGPDNVVLASRTFKAGLPPQALNVITAREGFHALRLKTTNAPAGSAFDYKLSVTYTAPKQLLASAGAVLPVNGAVAPGQANDPKEVGRWNPVFALPNVAIHSHLLPDGKVLFWGRRDHPGDSLDVHECTPQVWDPVTRKTTPTPQPKALDGSTINLFCSGHTILPDGKLLVVGGHINDGNGLNQATVYDYRTGKWTALPIMNAGRWYPSAVTLADGTALVLSGSHFAAGGNTQIINDVQQIWDGTAWRSIVNFIGLPLYPRVHVAPNDKVFMSGTNAQTFMLDTSGQGNWVPFGGSRINNARDYAPSVMYDVGKIVYIGGGNDPGTDAPTANSEIIDLTAAVPAWRATSPMHHRRRQHNATILPDGTVLVTGGTQGGGGPNHGFNDLNPGEPVHVAELWDPATGQWTELAAEAIDRCYHSTALLLPDATVLSAGGGEYRPDTPTSENPPKDSHREAQIYNPPYLFRGPRPDLPAAPDEVVYGETFAVGTSQPADIGRVSWIRLPSVTHSFDQNQRINFLSFKVNQGKLMITAPDRPEICPPGHYMLFVLNKAKVPSPARIVRIDKSAAQRTAALAMAPQAAAAMHAPPRVSPLELDSNIVAQAKGTRVVVGLTSKCPYGIGACWGGAYEALQQLDGVRWVRPVPNTEDSTAEVFLHDQTLPDVENWPAQLARTANGSYTFRGVEITINAELKETDGVLRLVSPLFDAPVELARLRSDEKIQFDRATSTSRPASDNELTAYEELAAKYKKSGGGIQLTTVTGPLTGTRSAAVLHVRAFLN